MNLSEHFTLAEAVCKCGNCTIEGNDLLGMHPINTLRDTAHFAETVRAVLGQPMQVHSWVRCPARNKAVGGALDSMHLRGYAVDFTCKHLSPHEVQTILKNVEHRHLIGGLGCYPGFTHIDRRATIANW